MLRQLAIVFVLALCANTLLAQTPDNEKPSSTNDAENKNNLESRFGGFSDLNGDSSMYLGYRPIGWNRPGYGGGWNRPGFGGGYNRPGFGGGYGRPGIGGGWGRPGYGGGWGGGRPGYGPY